jgi:hypothetical protein
MVEQDMTGSTPSFSYGHHAVGVARRGCGADVRPGVAAAA